MIHNLVAIYDLYVQKRLFLWGMQGISLAKGVYSSICILDDSGSAKFLGPARRVGVSASLWVVGKNQRSFQINKHPFQPLPKLLHQKISLHVQRQWK